MEPPICPDCLTRWLQRHPRRGVGKLEPLKPAWCWSPCWIYLMSEPWSLSTWGNAGKMQVWRLIFLENCTSCSLELSTGIHNLKNQSGTFWRCLHVSTMQMPFIKALKLKKKLNSLQPKTSGIPSKSADKVGTAPSARRLEPLQDQTAEVVHP